MKLNKIEILALVSIILVTFSGCITEKKVTLTPELAPSSAPELAVTPPSREENKPEITIVSFSSVYMRDNIDKDKNEYTYNLSERFYAVYNLSIRNPGSSALDFDLNNLNLRIGDETFNTTTFESFFSYKLEVLSDNEKANKIEGTTLYPNQTLNGDIVFRINSSYGKSFVLMYNTTPVTSPSFERALEALIKAEQFNYSVALGIPPYSNSSERGRMLGSYEPKLEDYPYIWANWMNKSVFEFFKKSDSENLLKSSSDYIPLTEIVYALKVTSRRNITMLPIKTQVLYNQFFVVVDEDGNEIINHSHIQGISILNDDTYEFHPNSALNIPQKNFSDATVVQISFQGLYGWSMAMRMPYLNQDIILNDKLNISVVRYNPEYYIS
jgi:hypothetical protein